MEEESCVQELHWHAQNVNSVTTIPPKTRRHILTGWRPRNIVDSARLTHCTRKQSKPPGKAWGIEMGDSAKKQKSPGFFSGVKAEFKKIVWPDRQETLKQSVAVVAISVVMGVIIAIIDYVAKNGVHFLTSI